jgi:hypothetical protein
VLASDASLTIPRACLACLALGVVLAEICHLSATSTAAHTSVPINHRIPTQLALLYIWRERTQHFQLLFLEFATCGPSMFFLHASSFRTFVGNHDGTAERCGFAILIISGANVKSAHDRIQVNCERKYVSPVVHVDYTNASFRRWS